MALLRKNFVKRKLYTNLGFTGGSVIKVCHNAGDMGLIPGSETSLGEGNSYPLQHSCLENLLNRGAWHAIVHGVAKSGTKLVTNSDCIYQFTACNSLMYYLHVVNKRVLELEIAQFLKVQFLNTRGFDLWVVSKQKSIHFTRVSVKGVARHFCKADVTMFKVNL